MKTYTDRATAPLIFHDLNRYARLPISICVQAFSAYGLILGFTYQWFNYFDLIFALLFLFLLIIAFIGCMKWRPSAWYALMALCILGIIYNLLYLFLFGTVLENSDYAKPLVQIIGDSCVIVYYLKRKPLFFSSAEPQLEDIEAFKEETSTHELDGKEDHPLVSAVNNIKPKKLFSKENIPLMLCATALICSIIGNFYQSSINQTLNQEVSNLNNDYADAIENRNHYRTLLYEISDEYNFYHNYAVIVTENDPYYHTYDCDYVGESSFWIYNVEAAISRGYKPCPVCAPPQ